MAFGVAVRPSCDCSSVWLFPLGWRLLGRDGVMGRLGLWCSCLHLQVWPGGELLCRGQAGAGKLGW